MNEREPSVNWYFVHNGKPDGAGYFVGYERRAIGGSGSLGMSGFRADPVPAADWIPVSGEARRARSPYLAHSGTLEHADPHRWDVPPRLVYVPSGNGPAQGRPRRADGHDRFSRRRDPIVAPGVPMLASFLRRPPSQGNAHPGADDATDRRAGSTASGHQGLHHPDRSRPREPGAVVRDRTTARRSPNSPGCIRPGKTAAQNRSMVYRIAGDGRSRNSSSLTCKTRAVSERSQAICLS